ncbi:hypothetical protein AB6A40_000128 [Gnathostoma spinigerum]|uniref:Ig-like domain-containing protein n=1 Tax=Gnathostoma spinigerum TaxID=75299 RepID=A0ABD6E5Q4_9BILA
MPSSTIIMLQMLRFSTVILSILIRPTFTQTFTTQFPQNAVQKEMATLSEKLDADQLSESPFVRFTKLPEAVALRAGESLELACEAIGVPPPVISWTLNGKLHVTNNDFNIFEKLHNIGLKTVQSGVTASKIIAPCVTKKHQGIYKCIASNGHKSIETQTNVKIIGISKCSTLEPSRPIINMWTDGRFERSGAAAQLFCRSYGSPKPQITWYDEDKNLLNHNSNFQVLSNGDLMIYNAQWADLGVYTCVASNKYGEDRVPVFFYPTEPEKEER